MKTHIIIIILSFTTGVGLALGATNDVVFANSYEKLTGDIVKNFKEDENNLLTMCTTDRSLETKLWLQLLNQIDRVRDLNFNPQDPTNRYYANVAPPFDPSNTNTWGYESGIDPAAIKDPQVRQAYEDAIRENHQKALRSLFEFRLKNLDSSCTTHAVNYFKSAYTKTPSDAKELVTSLDIINDALHKDELKKQLVEFVEVLNKTQ